jgi:Ca-activated chloride channel homolog
MAAGVPLMNPSTLRPESVIQIGNASFGWLALAIPLLLALSLYGVLAKRRAHQRFASVNLAADLFPQQRVSPLPSSILLCGILALLVLALLDIRWGKAWQEVPQKGIEVVFALDVSRSMLAEDTSPNRLERAKQQISDLLDEMAGDRVGLVVFADQSL